MATRIIDIDLGRQLPSAVHASDVDEVEAVVWLHGRPLGRVHVPQMGLRVHRRALARSIIRWHADAILRELVRNGLATPGRAAFDVAGLLSLPAVETPIVPGDLTAVICTDGSHPDRLDRCLASLAASGTPPAEVIVVCGGRPLGGVRDRQARPGATDGGSARLEEVQERWSAAAVPVRWLVEPSADLARARSLAVESTQTPLVAFVDESVTVDAHWSAVVCRTFQEHPNAVVVAGLVLPDGIENETGRLASCVLDRMAWRNRFCFFARCLRPDDPLPREWLNPLQYGATAAVAYRTEAVVAGGGFHPVAAGDAAAPGQHFDLWLRLLEGGMCVVHEPAASCRADAAPAIAEAAAAIRGVAAGISAALTAAAARRPRRLPGIALVATWFLRAALGDLCRSRGVARSLAWARLRGHLAGMARGCLGRTRPSSGRPSSGQPVPADGWFGPDAPFQGGRVVPIDLALPSAAAATNGPQPHAEPDLLTAAATVPVAEILATWGGDVLGLVEIVNAFRPVTIEQARRAVIDGHWDTLLVRLLEPGVDEPHEIDGSTRAERAERVRRAAALVLGKRLAPQDFPDAVGENPSSAAAGEPISVVIPSCDRPAELRECLRSVLAQKTPRRVEVIVVDNHPGSGLTPPVVAEFPDVRLLAERRRGAAYARNRGLLACRGSIVVCVDDDVLVSDGWLERLLAPFADQQIAVVTGNVVPLQLETAAERLTESCCSLSAGSEPFRVDGDWFHASPAAIRAWDFGASANMAVRTRVFRDPAVGLFAEALGPGTPVGAGEDPYFFYRVVEAGYGLMYRPDAWVWHRHRRTSAGLRRQVYNYAKSAVGYFLLTGFWHGDRRSRSSLLGGLQIHYCRRLLGALRGRNDVPVWLVLTEIAGHLAGGFAYVVSEARRRGAARALAHSPTPGAPSAPTATSEQNSRGLWAIDPGRDRMTSAASRRRQGRLPDFLVIGAQKSGTTALHENLKQHPAIELVPHFSSSKPGWNNQKETHFLAGRGAWYGIGSLQDYALLFNDNGLIQGEVCPSYSAPKAVKRIADTVPEAKLIYICREPVARIESAINHMLQWLEEWPDMPGFSHWSPTLSVDANIQRELASPSMYGLLRTGLYADTVEQVLRHFPRERLLLLVAEEYRDDPQHTYDTICSFLGVERWKIAHCDAHVRRHTYPLSPEQRTWLADFYRPHNERFFALLGREVSAWLETRSSAVTAAGSG